MASLTCQVRQRRRVPGGPTSIRSKQWRRYIRRWLLRIGIKNAVSFKVVGYFNQSQPRGYGQMRHLHLSPVQIF